MQMRKCPFTHGVMSTAAALALSIGLITCGTAWGAQDPPPAPAAGGGFSLPPVESTEAPRETDAAPVHLTRVEFRGNRAVRTSALQGVAATYLGRDLNAADIEELRIALTRQYTDRGYINSGVLIDAQAPAQEGVLSFLAVEGRIRDIRVHGLGGLRQTYVVDRLRGADDEILNTNVLRGRFQRLLDDPMFARINSRIEPGAERGDATLDVSVERARPYSLALALNNYRPPSIGEKAYDLSAQVRDLTGLGDVVDADINGPVEFTGGFGYSVDWRVPVNHHGTQVSVSSALTNSVITEEPLAALDIRSTIERQEFKIAQALVDTLSQNFSISAGISRERNATHLAGEEFSFLPGASNGVTRAISERLVPDYSYRSEHQFLGLRLTILHASLLDQPTADVFYAAPSHSYFVYTGQLHHLWQLSPLPFELEARATLQRTNARISDLHALELGGVNSVRGVRENEILVANAQNLNLDARWRAIAAADGLKPALTLGTFFDWAAGHDKDDPNTTLSSYGLTTRLRWSHVQADVAYGLPLIHPGFVSQQHGTWQDHGFHVQIAMFL